MFKMLEMLKGTQFLISLFSLGKAFYRNVERFGSGVHVFIYLLGYEYGYHLFDEISDYVKSNNSFYESLQNLVRVLQYMGLKSLKFVNVDLGLKQLVLELSESFLNILPKTQMIYTLDFIRGILSGLFTRLFSTPMICEIIEYNDKSGVVKFVIRLK